MDSNSSCLSVLFLYVTEKPVIGKTTHTSEVTSSNPLGYDVLKWSAGQGVGRGRATTSITLQSRHCGSLFYLFHLSFSRKRSAPEPNLLSPAPASLRPRPGRPTRHTWKPRRQHLGCSDKNGKDVDCRACRRRICLSSRPIF